MKKILLALLLSPLSLFAQESPYIIQKSDFIVLKNPAAVGGGGGASTFDAIGSGTNTTATMTCGTGCTMDASGSGTITATAVPVGGISGLGAGVATWLATATSANLRTAISDETGSGVAVFNDSPTMIAPNFANGTVEAGSFTLAEDGDNGSSVIRVRGQDSLPGSRPFRFPDAWPTAITGTSPTLLVGVGNSKNQMFLFDDFICGQGSSASTPPACLNWNFQQTSATWANATTFLGGLDAATPPGVARCRHDSSGDLCGFGGTSSNSMLLMDGWRFAMRMKFSALSDATDNFTAWIGSNDSILDANEPTNGVYFKYNHALNSGHWTIVVRDDAAEGEVDCSNASPVADTFQELAAWYEAGVGVHFYVDQVECTNSPINTNLPTVATEEFGAFRNKVARTAGSATNRDWIIDYAQLGPTAMPAR